ncbi:MAG: type III pantothenate kinase [Lachnospiraceae bacterium]|nr:type III pantothenate kinase [Lachnospiraceae bacterium]MBQ4069487.1 type III pantothenate kinase [Lachnospiraceae bacterium]
MLLAVDVGNTNITFGVFNKENLEATFRMTTKLPRTSDEYGITIRDLLGAKGIDWKIIEDVIISSVVPNIMHSFQNSFIKYFDKKPMIVGPGVKTGIKLPIPNPNEVGSDRIVDAVGAYYMYGGPVIVIDYGTATTYDYISSDASLLAAVTSPGIRISAKALWEDAAKLPEIEIKKPESIMAKETISSMQAGLVYGYIGQTEYIIDKIKEECGEDNVKVVATGGLGKLIADETDKIDIYDMDLTLHGLRIIYEKTKGLNK